MEQIKVLAAGERSDNLEQMVSILHKSKELNVKLALDLFSFFQEIEHRPDVVVIDKDKNYVEGFESMQLVEYAFLFDPSSQIVMTTDTISRAEKALVVSKGVAEITERIYDQDFINLIIARGKRRLEIVNNEERTLLVGVCSHDLKAYFSNILTATDQIKNTDTYSDPVSKYLEIIGRSANKGLSMVDDISFLSIGRKMQYDYFILSDHISNIISDLPVNEGYNLLTDFQSTGKIYGSKKHINSALLNLVVNAKESMQCNGDIKVGTYSISDINQKDRFAALYVKDNGIGMDKETRDNLFDLAYTKKSRGSGLGLFSVKKIVDSHQGSIEVSSEYGKGTRFDLFFNEVEY